MGKGVGMWNFGSDEFESIIPIGLEDMITLLMNILPTLVIKISQIDLALTLQKRLRPFPIMHGIHKHRLQLVNSVIQP